MTIRSERRGRVLILTISRPEAMNSLDVATMIEFRQCFEEFRDDPGLAVAILTGDGDVAFCTGADLKQTMPPSTSFAEGYLQPAEASIESGIYTRALALDELRLGKPVIAAVNGHCLGGGLEVALACDLRIASTTATFGLPEPRWASTPALGGVTRLLHAVPTAVAMKMLLTGDRIHAEEAHRIGLISDLVQPADLLDTAIGIAERIAANGPLAIRAVKQAARAAFDLPLSESVAQEQLWWGLLRDTEDRVEGRRAFTEKRPPEFRGK